MRRFLAGALALASLLCAPARAATTVTASDGSSFTMPFFAGLSASAPGGYMPLMGVVCFAGCSSSGGGGGGTVTQGTAASASGAWPFYLVQGTTANSAGNPIFVQLTAGAATVGTVNLGTLGGAATDASLTNAQGTAAGGAAPSKAFAIGAIYNATPPSFTDGQFGGLRIDSDGSLYANLRDPLPAGTNTIGAVKAASVTPTVTAATVGTSSAQAVASATWTYVAIDNESASASVACSFGGTAALNSAGSWTVPPSQTRIWVPGTAPSGAINCIASAVSTPVTIASY
jgi:hypothetical protein